VEEYPDTAGVGSGSPSGEANPVVAIGVALATSAVGAVLVYVLSGKLLMGQSVPVLVVGPLVGLALRLICKGVPHGLAIAAVVIALLGATVGFILAETLIYIPFMMDMAFKRILSLQGVIVFGFSGYFTYIIARRSQV
jgi:hypothetical protein